MDTKTALKSTSVFPVPENQIDKILIDRSLDGTAEYTAVISLSQAFRLATADVMLFVATSHNLTEQDSSINLTQGMKEQLLAMSNVIYKEYDDPKFTGRRFGFIGEKYNDQ